jgi:ABC-type tungstate transport system substrate-binding protein
MNWAVNGTGLHTPPRDGARLAGQPSRVRSASSWISVLGAGVIWIALLGPVIALIVHLSPHAIASALSAPGALSPLAVSLESGAVTLAVLLLLGTPLAWLLARQRLPAPRVWEAGVLAMLLLPPLVIGLLLVFMVGPLTPVGRAIGVLHLSATNTFFALVVAQVYESAPYYVVGAQAAFSAVDPRMEDQAAVGAAVRPRAAGGRPAPAAGRVHLERSCSTSTSRLTAVSSRWPPGSVSAPASGWPYSACPGRARPRCWKPSPAWCTRGAATSRWPAGR